MLHRSIATTAVLSLTLAGLVGCGTTTGVNGLGLKSANGGAGKVYTRGGVAQIIVKHRGGNGSLASLSTFGAKSQPIGSLSALGYQMVSVPAGNLDSALSSLKSDPSVLSAEANLERRAIRPKSGLTPIDVEGNLASIFPGIGLEGRANPNDPLFGKQYAPQLTHAVEAWASGTGKGIITSIVDTGVDPNHPDLLAHMLPGWNTVSKSNNAKDDYGHGTHCAGITAALANNNTGITGIAPDTKILPVKVLGADGSGSDETVANGIIWAADHGAKVISLSLGGSGESKVLGDSVAYALKKGASVVAAMGNDGTNEKSYPAAYPGVIAVGASDKADKIANFSQFGSWISVSAPGVRIHSTMPSYHVAMNDEGFPMHYGTLDGTSMATPAVSGEVAILRQLFPNLDPAQIKARVEKGADKVSGQADFDQHYGFGRINVLKAIKG